MASYSYADIEAAWIAAGGPADAASTMAAIAMAESGGSDVIQQGQPYSSTGWGVWQITPGNSESQCGTDQQLLTLSANACAAVAKFKSQGFNAWTTYTSGAYKKFLQNTPPSNTQPNQTQPGGAGIEQQIAQGIVDAFLNGMTPGDFALRFLEVVGGAIIIGYGLLQFFKIQGGPINNLAQSIKRGVKRAGESAILAAAA